MLSKKLIPSIIIAIGLASVMFVLSLNGLNIPEAVGQAAAKTVNAFVTNDPQHAVPVTGLVSCPPELVKHWDKIVFNVTNGLHSQQSHSPPHPAIVPGREYDIKVTDDPTTVADIRQKVVDKLNGFGYTDDELVGPVALASLGKILDVEYDIECNALP